MVKLTDKCLNNAIESPVAAAAWLPADMKSNILKAQAEAGHKVNTLVIRTKCSQVFFLFRTGCEGGTVNNVQKMPFFTV